MKKRLLDRQVLLVAETLGLDAREIWRGLQSN